MLSDLFLLISFGIWINPMFRSLFPWVLLYFALLIACEVNVKCETEIKFLYREAMYSSNKRFVCYQ